MSTDEMVLIEEKKSTRWETYPSATWSATNPAVLCGDSRIRLSLWPSYMYVYVCVVLYSYVVDA